MPDQHRWSSYGFKRSKYSGENIKVKVYLGGRRRAYFEEIPWKGVISCSNSGQEKKRIQVAPVQREHCLFREWEKFQSIGGDGDGSYWGAGAGSSANSEESKGDKLRGMRAIGVTTWGAIEPEKRAKKKTADNTKKKGVLGGGGGG